VSALTVSIICIYAVGSFVMQLIVNLLQIYFWLL